MVSMARCSALSRASAWAARSRFDILLMALVGLLDQCRDHRVRRLRPRRLERRGQRRVHVPPGCGTDPRDAWPPAAARPPRTAAAVPLERSVLLYRSRIERRSDGCSDEPWCLSRESQRRAADHGHEPAEQLGAARAGQFRTRP
jgi:hypothetical protein